MLKKFHTIAKISLVCVYLIIVAGAVVRMTGSGMGCPDWPKCFGYYIPPTDASALDFKPNHEYKEGHVIKIDDYFYYAKNDFTTGNSLDINNWKKNTKHEYNTFNVTHTWIEYINRLFTAFAGIPILIMFIFSLFLVKKDLALAIASTITIFGMGFEAWLGKTVVDSNLLPYKITIHMIGSFVILASIIYLIHRSSQKKIALSVPPSIKIGLYIALLLTLIQVAIGTQVRQFVDEQVIRIGYEKELWLNNPNLQFYIHRTFSFLIIGVNLWLYIKNKKLHLGLNEIKWVLILIIIEVLTGVFMSYLDFPFGTQPLHLVMAALLFGAQVYLIFKASYTRKASLNIENA